METTACPVTVFEVWARQTRGRGERAGEEVMGKGRESQIKRGKEAKEAE